MADFSVELAVTLGLSRRCDCGSCRQRLERGPPQRSRISMGSNDKFLKPQAPFHAVKSHVFLYGGYGWHTKAPFASLSNPLPVIAKFGPIPLSQFVQLSIEDVISPPTTSRRSATCLATTESCSLHRSFLHPPPTRPQRQVG